MEAWLSQDDENMKRQMEVITIYVLSPFLFGLAHQSDKVYIHTVCTKKKTCPKGRFTI